MIARSTAMAGLAVALALVGALAFVSGELMVAGLCLLGVSFAIFLREREG